MAVCPADQWPVKEDRTARQTRSLDLIAQLEARVFNPDDWLSDYELELEVTFWLREDDPAFKEEVDNILATLHESLKRLRHPEDHWGLDDGVNYNIAHAIDGHPMQDELHCWLYHYLYDHTPLTPEGLLRIGHIWVNLSVIYQHTAVVVG